MAVSSSGHRLGQLIGDWWEEYVVLELLKDVCAELELYVDSRFSNRSCRGSKVIWNDYDGNAVDYDYVIELGGTESERGTPIAFFESFWRRGARHSKDKARDDTNKLLPMRDTYPTARLLGVAACGEFTGPAKDYVLSHGLELFFVAKSSIVQAFHKNGVTIDYPDNLDEERKAIITAAAESMMTPELCSSVASSLVEVVGLPAFNGFKNKIKAALSATPQEIRLSLIQKSNPLVFESTKAFMEFVDTQFDSVEFEKSTSEFYYEVAFSDGTTFSASLSSKEELQNMSKSVDLLCRHILSLNG